MARVSRRLLGLVLVTGCWRDPDAVAARFAVGLAEASDTVSLADAATPACPEGDDCSDKAPCLVAPKCVAGNCVGSERYWSRTLQVTSERDQIDAMWPTADGGLIAVGNAEVSTAPYGLARHVFALHLRADGQGMDGQPPVPLWLKQDAAHDHVLNSIVPLNGTHYLGVGRHSDVTGPLGHAPRNYAWWMLFDTNGGPEFDGKLEVDGSHAWNALAQGQGGAVLAVGVLDDSGLASRFTATGTKGWSRELLPADVTRARLQAATALPGAAESWLAAGYTVDAQGDAAAGWAVGLAGPGTEVAWNQTYSPPESGDGAFYWLGLGGAGEAIAVGALWPHASPPREFPPDAGSKTWFVRISVADGHRIAERTWQWAGNPGAFTVLPSGQIAVWQHGAPNAKTGSLLWLDAFGNILGEVPFPRQFITDLIGRTDGSVALGGVTYSGLGDSYLAQVGPWGAATCTDAGPCAQQTVATCNDGQACTADRCDASLGCTHTSLPDGSPCATGACHSGACTP